ncbi:cell wall bioproteinsis and architecture protein [Savitreella phatthalungensis]
MLTAHDYPSAQAADDAGVDVVLVGDSLAMVACGYDDTTSLGMDEMLYHCQAVKRGTKKAFLVGDMVFGSYEVSKKDALRNAFRFIQEGGMEAVKLEGGRYLADTVKRITRAGINVVGHVGLLPQRQASIGGFKVQGKTAAQANDILQDALALQEAGCMMIVLEAMPAEVGGIITSKLEIPTIGIGAGPGCSGQVLVQNDLLGVFDKFTPKFCKQYENLAGRTTTAIRQYHDEVRSGVFPKPGQHTYPMDEEQLEQFKRLVGL